MKPFFKNPAFFFSSLATSIFFAAPDCGAAEAFPYLPAPTRWAIDGGYGLRLWDADGTDPENQAYREKARHGWILGGDVAVFPLRNFGVGMAYYRFLSSTTEKDYAFFDGTRGESKDTYLIEYVGPSLYFKRDLSRVVALVQLGAGVIYYDNQHQAKDFPGVFQGAVPGYFGSVSADYKVTRWFGLGMTVRALLGRIEDLAYNGIDITLDPISLTRIDLSGGIRFYP
ncbi:MAG: hypothetical protein K0Q91_797 [Fibrobacteria bacterium]|jgi:hypothetical protein|nr:hypothetical protein [Fibrobacteria bacterium]